MTVEQAKTFLKNEIKTVTAKLATLEGVEKVLPVSELNFYPWGGKVVVGHPRGAFTHEEVIQVIKSIGGKWKKIPYGEYITYTHTELPLLISGGSPPPNCVVVEEQQWVEPTEGYYKTVKKIKCPTDENFDAIKPETT